MWFSKTAKRYTPYDEPTSEEDQALVDAYMYLALELDDDLKEIALRLPWRMNYIDRLLEVQKLRLSKLHLKKS